MRHSSAAEQLKEEYQPTLKVLRADDTHRTGIVPYLVVPSMLFLASTVMAFAWLGHLHFKQELSFWSATFFAWLLVLPEYALNIKALRLGYRRFSGGQMGAFRLCSGVICVTLVSCFYLGEVLTLQKLLGFGVIMLAVCLIYDREGGHLKSRGYR